MKKRDVKKVKTGEFIKLSKGFIKFHREYAYEFNKTGTDTMLIENAIGPFFSYMLIGRGYPYKAKIVDYLHYVGEGPGFRVEITFPCEHQYSTIVGYKDVVRIKK